MKTAIAVRLCLVALSILSSSLLVRVSGDEATRFSFQDYLVGTWEVFNTLVSASSHSVQHDVTSRSYFIFSNKTAKHLHVLAYENDTQTHTVSGRRSHSIEFDSDGGGNRGTWSRQQQVPFVVLEERQTDAPDSDSDSGSDSTDNDTTENAKASSSSAAASSVDAVEEEEEESPRNMQSLFTFDFDTHATTGIAVSTGVWSENLPLPLSQHASSKEQPASSVGGTYNLLVVDKNRFTLTVCSTPSPSSSSLPGAAGGDCVFYTWRRVLPPAEQTFFQKYGTYLMLGMFFMFQTYMKSNQLSTDAHRREQAVPASSATPITPTASTSNNRGGSAKKKS